ncbi:hypothetical protein HNP21_006291 [Bacillus aryabhattai]|uniref:Uncharacterized protein n=1 Tax=Priestia aryabhattai TaxID=412384 RepID=A0A7W3RJ19_PRIAR|nr:hypothetical protein [Priestia aryabhattai]MBA9043113.1 hypothetical protein [Priestia aryabhattai]
MSENLNDLLELHLDKEIKQMILKLYKVMISIESDFVIKKMSELELEEYDTETTIEGYAAQYQKEKIELEQAISKIINELTLIYSLIFHQKQSDFDQIEKYELNDIKKFETVIYLLERMTEDFYVNQIQNVEDEMNKPQTTKIEFQFFCQLIEVFEMITDDLSLLQGMLQEYLHIEINDYFDKELEEFEQELKSEKEI